MQKAAQKAQMEAYVRALQNPPVGAQPLQSLEKVLAPAPSPEWAQAWAQAQAHEEAQNATQKAGEDAYARALALNGWLHDKTRFLSKSPQNFSNSRNVFLDFQFYPNIESGTFRSAYNGTSSTTF